MSCNGLCQVKALPPLRSAKQVLARPINKDKTYSCGLSRSATSSATGKSDVASSGIIQSTCSQWFGATTPEPIRLSRISLAVLPGSYHQGSLRQQMKSASDSHFKITPELVKLAVGCTPLAMLLIIRGKAWRVTVRPNVAPKMPSSRSDSCCARRKIGDEREQWLSSSQSTAVLEHRSHGVCMNRSASGFDETPGFTVADFEDSLRRQR